MKRIAVSACVSTNCGRCRSKSCLLKVCSKLNLQVQKGSWRARSFFGSLRSSKFLPTRFPACSSAKCILTSEGFSLSTVPPHCTRHSLRYLRHATLKRMIPLVPTLALSFLSFTCSAFVILRIVIPILPPHPLSRRVAPVRCFFSNLLPYVLC